MKEDKAFKATLHLVALVVFVILILFFVALLKGALPAIKKLGFIKFLFSKEWDPNFEKFGALPFVIGTLSTSILALLITIPFSLSVAIFLSEYTSGFLSELLSATTELLAAVPSVIYGFWGLFVLVPAIRELEIKIGAPPYGVGILTASLILAVMITPYASSIAREMLTMVPDELKEAAFALGATKAETIWKISLPYAKSGIIAGMLLAFGRALGETMAVTMVIGNSNIIPESIFSPANTMASVIANEFTEATGDLYVSALIEIGLVLFVITILFGIAGKIMIKKLAVEK